MPVSATRFTPIILAVAATVMAAPANAEKKYDPGATDTVVVKQ